MYCASYMVRAIVWVRYRVHFSSDLDFRAGDLESVRVRVLKPPTMIVLHSFPVLYKALRRRSPKSTVKC